MKIRFLIFLLVCSIVIGAGTTWSAVKVQQAVCIDGSGSISPAHFALLKEGLARAVEDPTTMPQDGSVELTVIQFGLSGVPNTRVEVSPTVITSQTVADNVAATIRAIVQGNGLTPMPAAIDSAVARIIGSPNFPTAQRQVINISTNGAPQDKPGTVTARDNAVAAGIDLVCSEAVPGADTTWLLTLVWPQPGVLIPPGDYPQPPGSAGFVRKVANYDEYEEAIKEKIRFVTGPPIPVSTLLGLIILTLVVSGFLGYRIFRRRRATA
jgi:hypothetical protein